MRLSVLFLLCHILKHYITFSCIPFCLFQEQVIGRSYMIMFIVKNILYSVLLAFNRILLIYLSDNVLYYGNLICSDYNTLKIIGLQLFVPIMLPDLGDCYPGAWISIQYFLYQIFALLRYESRYQVVTVQYFLI